MIKKIIIEAFVICVCTISVLCPGFILDKYAENNLNEDRLVPENMYIAANTSMAKIVSEKLKTEEKIQLVTGEWSSQIYSDVKYETSLTEYEAATLARENMGILYEQGKYQIDLESYYANWYSWTAKSYKAVDTIFNTYTVYYWIVEFEKYDNAEHHTVYVLEDGTILSASGYCDGESFEYTYEVGTKK